MKASYSYVDVLKGELEHRRQRNLSYSLRAFAQTLGLTAPHLSNVLKGKKGLSLAMAHQISDKLKFDDEERQKFCDLVSARHARKSDDRFAAVERLNSRTSLRAYQKIEIEQFKMISEWHHFAILHAFELADFESSATWIAGRIGLSPEGVREALRRLERLDLIDRTSRPWRIKRPFNAVSSIPSSVKRKYQHGILKKAQVALDEQKSEDRDYSSIVLSIDTARIGEAKTWLQDFRRKFCSDLDVGSKKDGVYCLSIQFFSLTK